MYNQCNTVKAFKDTLSGSVHIYLNSDSTESGASLSTVRLISGDTEVRLAANTEQTTTNCFCPGSIYDCSTATVNF